jgi:hypothetical protein
MSTTKSSRRKSPQHIFKLSGVNPEEIDKQYFKLHKIEKLTQLNNTSSLSEKFIPHQSTKISELQTFNANQNITVVDELKNTHNAKVSTVSGDTSRLCCFWDRHPFPHDKIIYCPVEKIQSPQIKSYTSYINGKPYKIQDSINLKTEYDHYYVDGIFCSIECCLAFIEEAKANPLYQYSEYYLRDIFSFTDQKCAPHWRLLQSYGGNMTIEEFRKSFTNTIYTPDGIIYNPICFLYRENYHL